MKRRGFTLIELLVVVGIISLLVSILLPSLARAKNIAKRVICLSNLRSMAVAAQQYTAEYDGFFPKALDSFTQDENPTYSSIAWDFRYRRDGKIEAGLLWEKGENTKIQQCPSFEGPANWSGDEYTGYNYNTSYVGHGCYENIPEPARIGDVKRASNCALFGDGEYGGGANKFMRAPFPNPGDASFLMRYAGTQGFRHLGTTNVSFCDGHAESLSERYTDISPSYQKDNIGEGTGFLSPDNRLYDLE